MKASETLKKIGLVPEQVTTSLLGTQVLIMDDRGMCHVESGNWVPVIIYNHFIYDQDGSEIEKDVVMDVMGWGKLNGENVQMYKFKESSKSFCARAGSMLDRYLKELFNN